MVPRYEDVRFVAVALVSKWCPDTNIYDLLPLLWPRSGVPMMRCTICCYCFGSNWCPNENVRFVAVTLVSKWCSNAKIYDMLPLLWPRSGGPMLRCTICCHCFGFEVVPKCYYLRFVAVDLVSTRCPNSKMYDLLLLLWPRSGAQMLGGTICCRCFRLPMLRCTI